MGQSLKVQTGYLNQVSHGCLLPYIVLTPFKDGTPLKFLIVTGATMSFIDPLIIPQNDQKKLNTPIPIKTVLKVHFIEKKTEVKLFNNSNEERKFDMFIFHFHDFFQGLIGMDILQQINAVVDIPKLQLQSIVGNLKLYQEQNVATGVHVIDEESKTLVRLPVTVTDGTFLCDNIDVNKDLVINGGLYQAKDGYSLMEIVNYSEEKQNLCVDSRIKVNEFAPSDYLEAKPTLDYITKGKSYKSNSFELLRTDHLNDEEKTELKKLTEKFPNLFYQQSDPLTFTNLVKHKIKLTDENPIYTKPFRYSHIESQEVRRQINRK